MPYIKQEQREQYRVGYALGLSTQWLAALCRLDPPEGLRGHAEDRLHDERAGRRDSPHLC